MAKKKKKKSGEGMGEFFKLNSEKIGFAVICLLALSLILFSIIGDYYGKGFTPAKYSPEKLSLAANQAETAIDSTESKTEVNDAVKQRVENKLPLPKKDYHVIPFDPILKEEKAKRGEPQFFPVKSLEISTGRGAFCIESPIKPEYPSGVAANLPLTPDAESSVAQGQYYVIVKGLVPHEAQKTAYQFLSQAIRPPANAEGGVDKFRMQPVYRYYNVQRAELKPGETAEKLDWKVVKVLDAKNDIGAAESTQRKRWAAKYSDIVHASILEPGITPLSKSEKWQGLPPRLQRVWYANEVCHSSLVEANRQAVKIEMDGGTTTEPMTDEPDDDELGFNTTKREAQPQQVNFQVKATPAVPYRLFRYIDYNVVPGKRYVYRVQLRLLNPNIDLAARYIAKSEYGIGAVRTTPWSEPSPVAEISADETVLVGSITPLDKRPKAYDEPHVQIDSLQWLSNEGYYLSNNFTRIEGKGKRMKTFNAMRGDLLNTTAPGKYTNPLNGIRSTNATLGPTTNNILVDFRGEKDLSLKTQPAILPPQMVLVSNSEGKLEIHYPDVDNAQRAKYGLAPGAVTNPGGDDDDLTDPKPNKPDRPNVPDVPDLF